MDKCVPSYVPSQRCTLENTQRVRYGDSKQDSRVSFMLCDYLRDSEVESNAMNR